MKLNYHNVEFIKSAAAPEGFLKDGLPQVAFAGRSNAGKSSVINCILNRRSFARVSATPGKTAHVNYFLIDKKAYFADLPGYGFAKVPDAERRRWGKLMEAYFAGGFITLGILILDIRRDPNADDRTMLDWFLGSDRPFVVLANKCDKLSPTAGEKRVEELTEALELPREIPLIRFSAEKGTGKERLMSILDGDAF